MLKVALIALTVGMAVVSGVLRAEEPRRPNIVFVLSDDHRWSDLSCMGHPNIKTPHIDRLAAEGVLFRNAFCVNSLCSPSRASIQSGLYPHAHGVTGNFIDYPDDLASFPRQLQKAGYRTAYIGKWHMGEESDDPRPGFDHFVTHKGQGKYYDTEFNFNGKERKVVKGYYTTRVTDMALEWLAEQDAKRQPFLLMLGHKAPHSFYIPEDKYKNAFDHVDIQYPKTAFMLDDKPKWIKERLPTWHGIYGPLFDYRKDFPDDSPEGVKDFAAMVRAYRGTILSIDDSVGRLYEALKAMGELDNTIFIYTTDNGILEGEHGMVDKRTMHEASIRIPLVVRYPGFNPDGKPRVVEQMVLTTDFAPTLLDLCDAEPLENIHGRSWRKLAEGKQTDWRKAWYYAYNYEKQFPYTPNVRGVRTDEWKYIRYPHGDGGPDRHKAELYHIAEDPEEHKNLIDDPRHAEKVKELQKLLVSLMDETGALPDKMPIDQGIGQELPDPKIR